MNQSSVKGNKVFGLAIQGVNGKAGLPDTSVTRPSASPPVWFRPARRPWEHTEVCDQG
ncbi:hypothetical protein [Pantoea agglomerans]|uniref:hypothetical protein n=1 Tax=Enterobacter agglomerans TaxID=549 RepID=UPI001F1AF5F4|nr:hypothetical protein [Pantoea agglomerans]MDH1171205.1 hypothetical protein [Pantoea agglomerans]UJL37200.1 hypothetical protein JK642_00015 [Pantoea agglomerans]